MDEDDRNSDRLPSERPDFPHERTGSMSLGAPPTSDEVSPINGDSAASTTTAPPVQDPNAKVVHDVVNSEVRRIKEVQNV